MLLKGVTRWWRSFLSALDRKLDDRASSSSICEDSTPLQSHARLAMWPSENKDANFALCVTTDALANVRVCRGKTVMLDCGIHPGLTGMNSLPFLDEINLQEVDAMLVTHFHLDHCAAVPYVVGHTDFQASFPGPDHSPQPWPDLWYFCTLAYSTIEETCVWRRRVLLLPCSSAAADQACIAYCPPIHP
jgi:Metallo-beta-lactamase superfamily